MDWERLLDDPVLIENYELLKKIGIIDLINSQKKINRAREKLILQVYEICRKESVTELVDYVISCLSDEFVPSNIVFILNQGVMFNRIKAFAFRNLKRIEADLDIATLDPYEDFFRKYSGTTSFLIFESEMEDENLIAPFRKYNPEIVVPVNGISGLYGIILIGEKVLGQEYTSEEIAYINRLLRFTAVGIQNNIHYEHSVKDPKTDLYNHNFFVRRVSEEIARGRRSDECFSLIILDIDNFKRFNDDYGHLAGDEVILRLAELLKSCLREEDILSRFGGEEFMALLPDTDSSAAAGTAERLRESVAAMEIPWQNSVLSVSASFGIATFRNDWSDARELINAADEALYEAKAGGRNRCCFKEYRSGK